MNLNITKVFSSEVVDINNRQWSSTQLTADFFLDEEQAFHGTISRAGYLFIPMEGYNQFPDIKKIFWRNKSNRAICGSAAKLGTEITFSSDCKVEDKQAYQKILTPHPIDEGHWVPFPEYHCIPLLETTISLEYHWGNLLKMSQGKMQAEQNLQDFMARRRPTYDLRQYGC